MRNNDFILYESDLGTTKNSKIWRLAYQKFRQFMPSMLIIKDKDVTWLCYNKINTSKLCFSGFS